MNYIDFSDIKLLDYLNIFERAAFLKRGFRGKYLSPSFVNRSMAMLFHKPSTRTRLSFDVGFQRLGGTTTSLAFGDSQIGRGETPEDTARVVSSMVDLVVVRTFAHSWLQQFADASRVPVINALTDYSHPCQVMADIFTYMESYGSLEGKTVTWIGDMNNMARTWLHAAKVFNFQLNASAPKGYEFCDLDRDDRLTTYEDPMDACHDAALVCTDVWASMGQEDSGAQRLKAFSGWTVTSDFLNRGAPNCAFMHCLPAHRGQEVDHKLLDDPRSLVWVQAENRLHCQNALMEFLLL